MRSDAPALRPLRLLVLALALAPLPADGALLDHGFRIEGERMLRPGMWRFSGTFATESDIRPGVEPITGTPVDVNAIRFPFSWRYGFTSRLEVGTDVQFERDKGTDLGPAKLFDAGGVSNWDLVAKCKVFPWTTFVGHVGVYGNNKLYGGSDPLDYGLDILLTLPLNLPIGMPNLMHFNTGIRFKGGNPNIDLNPRLDARGYTDPIHLGWSLIVSPRAKWAAVGEILVRRSPYGLEEEAELTLGTRYAYTERSTLMASIARGVTDGSPNWALRLGFETTYGSQTERQVVRAEGRQQLPTEIPEEGPPPLEISVSRLTSIAEAAYQRGDYSSAADAFSELVSRLPSEGRVYYNLGVCYYHLKDYAKAEGDFFKALTLMPNDPEVYLYMGHCQFLQSRPSEARRSWEEALRLDPTNEMAKFLLQSSQ